MKEKKKKPKLVYEDMTEKPSKEIIKLEEEK